MNLAELMSDILDHSCPNGGIEDDGSKTFVLESHCVEWRVTANKSSGQWEIVKVIAQSC